MILKCAIPVFDGLLPRLHGPVIQDLLFELATWHTFAKLHLHTTDMLNFLDTSTKSLSQSVCKFVDTTKVYTTYELPQETAAHGRRVAVLAAKSGASVPQNPTKCKQKLNLQTYKFHTLGDYADTIQERGTTDNYSTQLVCTVLTKIMR